MENEIKVNEFVRYKDGDIIQIFQKIDRGYVIKDNKDRIYTLPESAVYKDIGKHSPNPIDIIEDEDFCKIEFYSPRYEKRVIRIFEVSKIDEYITFENFHCDLFMANGEWSCHDKRLNPVIKEIITKEMMESISYKVTKM